MNKMIDLIYYLMLIGVLMVLCVVLINFIFNAHGFSMSDMTSLNDLKLWVNYEYYMEQAANHTSIWGLIKNYFYATQYELMILI